MEYYAILMLNCDKQPNFLGVFDGSILMATAYRRTADLGQSQIHVLLGKDTL